MTHAGAGGRLRKGFGGSSGPAAPAPASREGPPASGPWRRSERAACRDQPLLQGGQGHIPPRSPCGGCTAGPESRPRLTWACCGLQGVHSQHSDPQSPSWLIHAFMSEDPALSAQEGPTLSCSPMCYGSPASEHRAQSCSHTHGASTPKGVLSADKEEKLYSLGEFNVVLY